MTDLEKKATKVSRAIMQGRSKEVVSFKFKQYMKVYDNADKSILDKQNHRDLFNDYCKYMYFYGDKS